jgi:alpha-glucosidase
VNHLSQMLRQTDPRIMESLVREGCTFSIIGVKEGQTDLPQYAFLRNDPNMDWNKRARGLGGQHASGGEENILELPGDRYRGESIFIHEFAHTLDEYGFSKVDPTFVPRLTAAYESAKAKGLWAKTYAITNRLEYFAEGVQTYFDCNRVSIPTDGIHNHVGNREQLKEYDPDLFAIIDQCFGGTAWRYPGKYTRTSVRVSAAKP